jgi:hypothetical protein
MDSEPKPPKLGREISLETRARWFPIVAALIPILFFVILYIINPGYMAHFFAEETRPCGLQILGLIALLSMISFPLLRASFKVIVTGRRTLGMILAMVAMAVFVFPAAIMVFLAPALLILLGA